MKIFNKSKKFSVEAFVCQVIVFWLAAIASLVTLATTLLPPLGNAY